MLVLLVETLGILALLATATICFSKTTAGLRSLLPVVVIAQGFWFHRLYVVAHEASHGKLWPEHRRVNDLLGQLMLLPLLVPLRIHRKIHAFHHGHNRRDHHTSALDTFVVQGRCGPLRRAWYHFLWYVGVFAGGWFVHSLVSVVFFLVLPLRLARKVSPAFKGWRRKDQMLSLLVFAFALVLQIAIAGVAGAKVWALTIGWPLLAFAWCYSLLVYIYHYGSSYGPEVRTHVRSLRPNPILRWWLLGFSDHAAHHAEPHVPWHALAGRSDASHEGNKPPSSVTVGILRQIRGPHIVELRQ